MNEKWPKKVSLPRMMMGRRMKPNSMLMIENQVLAVVILLNKLLMAYVYMIIPTPRTTNILIPLPLAYKNWKLSGEIKTRSTNRLIK
jgi:hypothetical protein